MSDLHYNKAIVWNFQVLNFLYVGGIRLLPFCFCYADVRHTCSTTPLHQEVLVTRDMSMLVSLGYQLKPGEIDGNLLRPLLIYKSPITIMEGF